jgi:hypothetical protein
MYIVYLTINIKNRKIYIGVHRTKDDNIFDGYIGNGLNVYHPSTNKFPKTIFQKAVKKYGFDSFQRITLFKFDNMEDAYEAESLIINEEFLKRDDVYNMKIGGIVSPDCSKEIHRYDLNGNYLESWKSIDTAAKELGCSGMSISFAHINKSISFNSLWSTDKTLILDLSDYTNIPQDKTVYKYDINGKYLTYYKNTSELIKELQCTRENVRDAISKEYLCKGYYLSYEKLDKFIIKEKIKRSSQDKIYQYDLEGNFIRQFDNCEHASNILGISKKSLQSKVATNDTYKGFQWSYTKEKVLENIKETSLKSKPIEVNQYTLNGEFVKTWDTYSSCRKEFPNVGKVLRGITTQCKGFIFKYKK